MTDANSEAAALERALGAWRAGALAELCAALGELGVALEETDAGALLRALAKANGRRQGHRVEPQALLVAVVDACAGRGEGARIPPAEDSGWLERRTQAAWIEARPTAQGCALRVGTEEKSSYVAPSGAQVLLELALARRAAQPPTKSAEPTAEALPLATRESLDALLFGQPRGTEFRQLAEALDALEESPSYAAAVRYAEAFVERWPDRKRSTSMHLGSSRELARKPHARLLRSLSAEPQELAALSEDPRCAPLLGSLRRLELRGALGDAAVELLAPLRALEELVVQGLLDPQAGPWLAKAHWPASLRRLEFTSGVDAEAFAPLLERLQGERSLAALELSVAGATMPALGRVPLGLALHVHHTFASSSFEGLAKELAERGLEGLKTSVHPGPLELMMGDLARTPLLRRLRSLEVSLPRGATAALFAQEKLLPSRLWLELHGSSDRRFFSRSAEEVSFDEADLAALLRAVSPERLRELRLSGVLGPALAARLAEGLRGAPLEDLELHASLLGNEGLAAFARAGLLRGLRALGLHEGGLTAEGAALLCDAEAGPTALRSLRLSKNSLSKKAALRLAQWPGLSLLERLDLRDAKIAPDARDALLASPLLQRASVVL